jgi:hypothetical protein
MSELRKIEINHYADWRLRIDDWLDISEKYDFINRVRSKFFEDGIIGYDCDHKEHYGNLSIKLGRRFEDTIEFLCTPTQTSGNEVVIMFDYPIVYKYSERILFSMGKSEKKPSVEASTHYGFYRGNEKINFVGHGHDRPIHHYFRDRESEAIIWDEEITYGSLEIMKKAKEAGSDERILMHESPYGNWGIAIPKGHFDAFFLVGESAKSVEYGFLESLNRSSIDRGLKANNGFVKLDTIPLVEEDFVRKD